MKVHLLHPVCTAECNTWSFISSNKKLHLLFHSQRFCNGSLCLAVWREFNLLFSRYQFRQSYFFNVPYNLHCDISFIKLNCIFKGMACFHKMQWAALESSNRAWEFTFFHSIEIIALKKLYKSWQCWKQI